MLGILVALIAFCVNLAVENMSYAKFAAAAWLLKHSLVASFLFYLACNVALIAVASVLTVYWAPGAAGSGIPEVKAYLNGVDLPESLQFRSLVGKMIGVSCVVSASMPLGKEGA